ncbi:RING/U-box superfamily protein [Forsythia ovata]|uniref:RING/U-box superfamily protein n=1 Tax=Forsythia ovata TaxID=205694 RepID=A0ABD1WAX7_9LAMI
MSGSSQSTLIQVGSWSSRSIGGSNNGSPNSPSLVPSPPTTPFGIKNNKPWDLIYHHSVQVPKHKLNGGDTLPGQPRSLAQLQYPAKNLNAPVFHNTRIAKTGSLCCVAARPHESNATSRDWSVGPHEPYWQTNTSFSPPPSRWDFRFHHEALSFGSHDDIQLYGSSTSSNSRESRHWVRGSNVANNQYLVSDGLGPYFSSPSDISPPQQLTPLTIQEIRADVYGASRGDVVVKPLSFSPTMEGTSAVRDSRRSTSSRSDSSCDSEAMVKSHSSHRNFSGRGCFMSKAVHPLSFPLEMPTREASGITSSELSEFDTTPPRDRHHLNSATASIDFTELSEHFDDDLFNRSHSPSDRYRCGLCERFLSQRSPWSSRRIVRSGDMPVAGILSCRHVFHAECLEQTTPKARKSDPPCPICVKVEEENSPDPRIISKLRSSLPRFKPFREDGPSKPWGCTRAGDCVERALHIPTRNTVLSLNRTRFMKSLSMKGNQSQEYPGKLRASGS